MSRCRGKVRESGVCEQFALEKEQIRNYPIFYIICIQNN